MKKQMVITEKIVEKRHRWKRRIVRYRQRFQAYVAYIAIIALFSIFVPFLIYYHSILPAMLLIVVLDFFVLMYLVFAKREFADKASWVILVIFLPFFGAFLFIFIGASQTQSRAYKEKIVDDVRYRMDYDACTNSLSETTLRAFEGKHYLKQFYLIAQNASYTKNNSFSFLESQNVYDQMYADIMNAKHHIHFEMYIARIDKTTKPIFDALRLKAMQGVQVRYLGDVLGHNLLKQEDIESLIYAGIEFTFFNEDSKTYFDHFHVNHRKMLIIDGEIGYTGGYNLGNEYVDGYPKKNLLWYDLMVRTEGEVVAGMQLMFLSDWVFSLSIKMSDFLLKDMDKFFPKNMHEIDVKTLVENPPVTQFLGSGPDMKKAEVKDTLRHLISRSEQKIYMTTPYLIPSDDLLSELKLAAKTGVDVRIIIPGVPDKKAVYYCTESYIEPLLDAGVKIYKMDKHFVHSKFYLFDDFASMFGTVNFDMRSFMLNFENNIVQLNDAHTNNELLKIYQKVEEQSTRIYPEDWRKRTKRQKLAELFFRAFAPLF